MITLLMMIFVTITPENHAHLLEVADQDGSIRRASTIDDWEVRRGHILQNMQLVMGPIPEKSTAPLNIEYEFDKTVHLDGYTRHKIWFSPEPNDRVPAYLLVPDNLNGPVPGILCPHPTNPDGKDMVVGLVDKANRNYAEELAQRGYVTLAPDYPGFGEYKPDVYAMGYASATAKGIVNHQRALDLLASLSYVDGETLGVIGHSLGGHNALFLAAFDQRVDVTVTSCGFNSFAKYKGGDLTGWSHEGYMPRIASEYDKDPAKMPFDFTEILGAIAPRSVFISAPLHDTNFEVSGVYDCIQAAEPVYKLYDRPKNLRAIHPDCEHDFPPDAREQAYTFIDEAFGVVRD